MNSKVVKFQILCVTMNQFDFSKIEEMNIHSDVVFANQCDKTSFMEKEFLGHKAQMISTNTKGVGINRNLALCYADADICILADDDIRYNDDLEKIVINEFEENPNADIIIFHLDTDTENRKLEKYKKTRKVHFWDRTPWGAVRVAFRLDRVREKNVWFSTLFGGGALFPCGEDSIWINDAKKNGLVFYVSDKTIGLVSCQESSWFTGFNEKRFYAAGALYAYLYPYSFNIWKLYFAIRTINKGSLSLRERLLWIEKGKKGFLSKTSYESMISQEGK